MTTLLKKSPSILKAAADGLQCRTLRTTCCLNELRKLACVNIVDNSMLGKKARQAGKAVKILHVYTPTQVGKIGDKVLVSVMGEKKQAYIVGCRQKQNRMVPRYDSNNIVLIEEAGSPTGTRIRVPVPSALRGKNDPQGHFTKILSLANSYL